MNKKLSDKLSDIFVMTIMHIIYFGAAIILSIFISPVIFIAFLLGWYCIYFEEDNSQED